MRVAELVEYSRNDIERMARDYLAGRPDFDPRPPVQVDFLLATTPNVVLDTLPGLVEKHGVEAAICSQLLSRELLVLVDEGIADSADDARYNAAVGEELSHILIHQSLFLCADSVEAFLELQRDPYWPRYELDARNFSAAIRMPCHIVEGYAKQIYPEIVDQLGYAQARQIELTLSARMSMIFKVPVDDMNRRLLTWPCEINRRVQRSVNECSSTLLGDGPLERIIPYRAIQQELPGFV